MISVSRTFYSQHERRGIAHLSLGMNSDTWLVGFIFGRVKYNTDLATGEETTDGLKHLYNLQLRLLCFVAEIGWLTSYRTP